MLDNSIKRNNLRRLKTREAVMVRIDKSLFICAQGKKPGKEDFGTWIFRIGQDCVWMEDCRYDEAEKRARSQARRKQISLIQLLV